MCPEKKTPSLVKGSGGRRPSQVSRTNTNDNLFSRDKVEFVLALGEGPIKGLATPDGLTPLPGADFRSFYVGGVPLLDHAGNPNFANLTADFFEGSPEGHTISLIQGGQSNNVEVGVTCTKREPLIRLTPSELRGKITSVEVRLNVTQLYIDNSRGTFENDLYFQIEYKKSKALDLTYTKLTDPAYYDPYSFGGCLKIHGKTSGGWAHDFILQLPPDPDPTDAWMIRVTKFSPDYDHLATTDRTLAEFSWESFQCITTTYLNHNNLAMVRVRGKSSDQFNSLPELFGVYDGLIVKVPNNYDVNALGSGAFSPINWNGVFKSSWTNNPAWVLYDLIMNPVYGWVVHSPSISVIPEDFYAAGVYCNESVLMANGSVQKRYTFNAEIREVQSSKDLLAYVAGCFGGVCYDNGNGAIRLRVDRWEEPFLMFTPECVTIDGFSYSYTDVSTRANDITVSFLNPKIGWVEDRRKVTDEAAIARNGRIPMDFVAVGCTDEDEAIRRAMMRLLTANGETTTVTFQTARLGLLLEPYDIVYLADPAMNWGQYTGRIERLAGRALYLRDALPLAYGTEYTMVLQAITGLESLRVTPGNSPATILEIQGVLPDLSGVPAYAQFVLTDASTNPMKPFRITAIEEGEPDSDLLKISALEVSLDKYNHPLMVVSNSRVINILVDTFNLNLYDEYFLRYGAPVAGVDIRFVLRPGILVSSLTTDHPAVDTGFWPAGIIPLLDASSASIAGRGGKGGQGGAAGFAFYNPTGAFTAGFAYAGEKGGDGGTAIKCNAPLKLKTNAATIISGGFGGGGGAPGAIMPGSYPPTYPPVGPIPAPPGSISASGGGGAGGWPYGAGGAPGVFTPPTWWVAFSDSYHVSRAGAFGTTAGRGLGSYTGGQGTPTFNSSILNTSGQPLWSIIGGSQGRGGNSGLWNLAGGTSTKYQGGVADWTVIPQISIGAPYTVPPVISDEPTSLGGNQGWAIERMDLISFDGTPEGRISGALMSQVSTGDPSNPYGLQDVLVLYHNAYPAVFY